MSWAGQGWETTACPHTTAWYNPSNAPAIVAVKSGDADRLAELLRVTNEVGSAETSLVADAVLTSRLYVRRRSEGDAPFRPPVGMTPVWEEVSGIATPPRVSRSVSRAASPNAAVSTPATPRRTSQGAAFEQWPLSGVPAASIVRTCPRGASNVNSRRIIASTDFGGLSALHHAAKLNRADMVKMLLEYGADVGCRNKAGLTPLHYAAENNAADAALVLVQNGADVHARETLTWQPLHCASWNRAQATATVLLAYGADERSLVEGGKCARMLARTKGHTDTVHLIEQASAKFTYRTFRQTAGTLEKEVLLHILLVMRRAAFVGKVPPLPSETLYAIFGFLEKRDMWRIGMRLVEYRPGFWHLPRLTLYVHP
eukprot:m.181513 g.181513  ORF g.181513 m.181513 type:complete len:371 (+) comp24599_c1_seq1:322-1434(+)